MPSTRLTACASRHAMLGDDRVVQPRFRRRGAPLARARAGDVGPRLLVLPLRLRPARLAVGDGRRADARLRRRRGGAGSPLGVLFLRLRRAADPDRPAARPLRRAKADGRLADPRGHRVDAVRQRDDDRDRLRREAADRRGRGRLVGRGANRGRTVAAAGALRAVRGLHPGARHGRRGVRPGATGARGRRLRVARHARRAGRDRRRARFRDLAHRARPRARQRRRRRTAAPSAPKACAP